MIKTICLIAVFVITSCTTDKSSSNTIVANQTSSLTISFLIRSPSNSSLSKVAATTWNKLITVISGSDMDTIFDTTVHQTGELVKLHSISSIPSGSNRKICSWTINSTNGKTIHFPAETTLSIQPASSHNILFTLYPCAGSLKFQFAEIDANVDSIFCRFASTTDTFETSAAKNTTRSSATLELDYIPHNMGGLLSIYGTRFSVNTRDTLYRFERAIIFNANSDSVMYAVFNKSAAAASMEIWSFKPGTTIIQGIMNGQSDSLESGSIYISEVFVKENYEYMEIHNPTADSLFFDTLYLNFKGTDKLLRKIAIPADGFFVLGRAPFAGVDTLVSSFDLLSSGYEPILLKNSKKKIIDMIYVPSIANSSRSMEVVRPGNVLSNNFDHNWLAATTEMVTEPYFGTPGF